MGKMRRMNRISGLGRIPRMGMITRMARFARMGRIPRIARLGRDLGWAGSLGPLEWARMDGSV
jgi:hypothetical protein